MVLCCVNIELCFNISFCDSSDSGNDQKYMQQQGELENMKTKLEQVTNE